MAQGRRACADQGQSSKSKVIGNVAHQTGEVEIEMKRDEDDVIQTQPLQPWTRPQGHESCHSRYHSDDERHPG